MAVGGRSSAQQTCIIAFGTYGSINIVIVWAVIITLVVKQGKSCDACAAVVCIQIALRAVYIAGIASKSEVVFEVAIVTVLEAFRVVRVVDH